MITVKTDRASGMVMVAEKNRERVKSWFIKNPNRTISDCSRALGLTWQTVKKHVVDIQSGK